MLVIRLSRVGKKKQPTYRVVVQEKQRDPWGTSIEIVGNFNPRTKPSTLNLKEDRVKHWLERGAQPSPTVHNLLVDIGLVKGPKVRATCHDKAEPVPVTDSPAPAPAVTAEKEKTAPVEEAPVLEASTDETPTPEASAPEATVDEISAPEASTDETPAPEAPAPAPAVMAEKEKTAPVEEAPIPEAPAEESPTPAEEEKSAE